MGDALFFVFAGVAALLGIGAAVCLVLLIRSKFKHPKKALLWVGMLGGGLAAAISAELSTSFEPPPPGQEVFDDFDDDFADFDQQLENQEKQQKQP